MYKKNICIVKFTFIFLIQCQGKGSSYQSTLQVTTFSAWGGSKGMNIVFVKDELFKKENKIVLNLDSGIKKILQKLLTRLYFHLKMFWLKWVLKERLYYHFLLVRLLTQCCLERKVNQKRTKKDPILIFFNQKQQFLLLLNRHLLPSPRWRNARHCNLTSGTSERAT